MYAKIPWADVQPEKFFITEAPNPKERWTTSRFSPSCHLTTSRDSAGEHNASGYIGPDGPMEAWHFLLECE